MINFQKISIGLAIVITLSFSGCNSESGGGNSRGTDDESSVELIDSGFWGGAFGFEHFGKAYDSIGDLFLYNLSCNHNGYNGVFAVYSDKSAIVERPNAKNPYTDYCRIENIFKTQDTNDSNDINATAYDKTYYKGINTWYDSSTGIYYETGYYNGDGNMVGVVNNSFEALIKDDGGTQTIRLIKIYKELK